jgi:hypothetical protein
MNDKQTTCKILDRNALLISHFGEGLVDKTLLGTSQNLSKIFVSP